MSAMQAMLDETYGYNNNPMLQPPQPPPTDALSVAFPHLSAPQLAVELHILAALLQQPLEVIVKDNRTNKKRVVHRCTVGNALGALRRSPQATVAELFGNFHFDYRVESVSFGPATDFERLAKGDARLERLKKHRRELFMWGAKYRAAAAAQRKGR